MTRIDEILAEESKQPLTWWWLSFVDPDGPQFLGACLVQATGFLGATRVADRLGINPGGEVKGVRIPLGSKIPDEWIERLLTRDECEEFRRERDL